MTKKPPDQTHTAEEMRFRYDEEAKVVMTPEQMRTLDAACQKG